MEHKIGEIITLPEGRKAEAVETKHDSCRECVFNNEELECADIVGLYCSSIHRTDHKNIIYKEIKDD